MCVFLYVQNRRLCWYTTVLHYVLILYNLSALSQQARITAKNGAQI